MWVIFTEKKKPKNMKNQVDKMAKSQSNAIRVFQFILNNVQP